MKIWEWERGDGDTQIGNARLLAQVEFFSRLSVYKALNYFPLACA